MIVIEITEQVRMGIIIIPPFIISVNILFPLFLPQTFTDISRCNYIPFLSKYAIPGE